MPPPVGPRLLQWPSIACSVALRCHVGCWFPAVLDSARRTDDNEISVRAKNGILKSAQPRRRAGDLGPENMRRKEGRIGRTSADLRSSAGLRTALVVAVVVVVGCRCERFRPFGVTPPLFAVLGSKCSTFGCHAGGERCRPCSAFAASGVTVPPLSCRVITFYIVTRGISPSGLDEGLQRPVTSRRRNGRCCGLSPDICPLSPPGFTTPILVKLDCSILPGRTTFGARGNRQRKQGRAETEEGHKI